MKWLLIKTRNACAYLGQGGKASFEGTSRGGSSRKNLGGPWPRGQGRKWGSGGEAPANILTTPFLS